LSLSPGTRLGPYEILAPLGAGGMGEVYRARDSKLDRDVAIKILPETVSRDPDRMARFEREGKALASLNHPNIVTVHSVDEDAGVRFLVMELVEGKPLAELIPSEGLPLSRFLDIAIPLADAVAAAHGRNIVHRDLKPGNVMMSAKGHVKVLDFGLAKEVAAGAAMPVGSSAPTMAAATGPLTVEGSILGTFPYMSPEQVRGSSADARSDLFSLGVVLYEMATGRHPFAGSSPSEVVSSILRDPPKPLLELRPDLPELLGRLVRRCLEKDPERRIQTSKDIRNELEELRISGGRSESGRGETAAAARGPALVEGRFVLTTDILRSLSERSPRLIGREMSYLDNGADSPTLVVLVHGLGWDQRQFERALAAIPERAVAPTLVGFDLGAVSRPPIGVEDHSRLLRALLKDLAARLRPAKIILAGYSSGADQCLRLAASDEGAGIEVSGLVALGPNVDLATCFATRRFAGVSADDPAQILAVLKDLGRDFASLPDWLTLQQYIVGAFSKLGADLDALKRYAADIVAPFEAGGDPLADWFRIASERIPYLRLVFSRGEAAEAEALLGRHLENNVLGSRFTEKTVAIEPVHHLNLIDPELVVRHIRDAAQAVGRA